ELPALRFDPVDQLVRLLRALLVFDPDVKVFRVLAHDDQIDVLEARAHAWIGLAGAHLRVQVEALPERDVDGAKAAPDRCRNRAFQPDPRLAARIQHLVGQRVAAVLVHHVGAGLADVPVEVDAGRLEDSAGRLSQLGAGAVAGDERYAMGHGGAWY